MPVSDETSNARAQARMEDNRLQVELTGAWRIIGPRPSWAEVVGDARPTRVRLVLCNVARWDSSLVLFIHEAQLWAEATGAKIELDALPAEVRRLTERLTEAQQEKPSKRVTQNFLEEIGLQAADFWKKSREFSHFVGECTLAALRLARGPAKFRWRDCLFEMQQCGAMALPIVSLISFLVGLIMAYQSAVQLRQFGADIFVADLVGLAVVREMGPMMAAVVLAGRTGAAFAAELGNMKAGEEIDALETLGIRAVDFLVLPRMVALALMMPLLALYANCVGILGGMIVSATVLQIPPSAYWVETQSIIDLSDLSTGLIKSMTFGVLIGLAGCLRGLQAQRSAAGVGRAATSAVVTSILLVIVADAIFAVLFNILHL
ncbi:MAG: ABC transporter permease [Verrucomicrobiota bacterium]|nr:ABC transporter permease [Verrucomicrobiota bacterium]